MDSPWPLWKSPPSTWTRREPSLIATLSSPVETWHLLMVTSDDARTSTPSVFTEPDGVATRRRPPGVTEAPLIRVPGGVTAAGELECGICFSGVRIVFGCTPAGSDAREASEVNTAHQFFADGAYMLVFTGGGDAASKKQHNIALCVRDAAARAENGAWRAKPAAKEEAIALMREKGMPRSAIDVAEACDRFFDVGVHYHDVMESWSDADGVVALVGDACHAMPPFLGQGANQAIQDALCVANELAKVGREHKTVKDALKTYENIRKPPTAAIMQSSRFIGALETGAGPMSAFRDVAFFVAGTLGITGKVFLSGAMPRFSASDTE